MRKITDFQQIKEYFAIPEDAVLFLERADASTPCGRYEFGDACYIQVAQVVTKKEVAPMEAHERYVDIQCLLEGCERILYADKRKLTISVPYDIERDIAFFELPSASEVSYKEGEGIVLYPWEAHLPGRAVEQEMTIKKAVVKLSVALIR